MQRKSIRKRCIEVSHVNDDKISPYGISGPHPKPHSHSFILNVDSTAHVLSQARSLLLNTLLGICFTLGLHYYRGMVIGLAIQSIMGPLNLIESAVLKAILLGGGFGPSKKLFQEKTSDELTEDDELVDAQGNPLVRSITKEGEKSFEDILLDTWDSGSKANLKPLMAAINKKNCNFKTKESNWTPLMILSGLGVKGSASAIQQVIELGGDPAILDLEGWNAMHWAAFHGSMEAAKALRDSGKLFSIKDKEGKTPLIHARAEGNDDIAVLLEELEAAEADGEKKSDGLRKRK